MHGTTVKIKDHCSRDLVSISHALCW